MTFRVWLKANAADKVLSSLRQELLKLFDTGSSVLDIGCGTGDLLFRAANKISKGHGIDLDRQMIQYANSKANEYPTKIYALTVLMLSSYLRILMMWLPVLYACMKWMMTMLAQSCGKQAR